MILRRITEHVKALNWFAVGLDFVIVVVGVFVGIQVANWSSDRLDWIEAGNVLARLEQEFHMHLERTDLSLGRHEASLAAAARLINGVRDGQLVESRRSLFQARTLAVSGRPSEEIRLAWSTEAVDPASLMSDPELMVALQMAYGTHDNVYAVLLGIQQRILRMLALIEAQQGEAP